MHLDSEFSSTSWDRTLDDRLTCSVKLLITMATMVRQRLREKRGKRGAEDLLSKKMGAFRGRKISCASGSPQVVNKKPSIRTHTHCIAQKRGR